MLVELHVSRVRTPPCLKVGSSAVEQMDDGFTPPLSPGAIRKECLQDYTYPNVGETQLSCKPLVLSNQTTPANAGGTTGESAGATRRGRVQLSAPRKRIAYELSRPTLVAGPLEGSSSGRVAGFEPVGCRFEPCPSSQVRGVTRKGYPRRMPCGTTGCHPRGRGFESRRALARSSVG
jgi:hypothetical protein